MDLFEELRDMSTMSLVSLYIHQHPSDENDTDKVFGDALGAELVRRKVLTITQNCSVWEFAEMEKQDDLEDFLDYLDHQFYVLFSLCAKEYLATKFKKAKAGV